VEHLPADVTFEDASNPDRHTLLRGLIASRTIGAAEQNHYLSSRVHIVATRHDTVALADLQTCGALPIFLATFRQLEYSRIAVGRKKSAAICAILPNAVTDLTGPSLKLLQPPHLILAFWRFRASAADSMGRAISAVLNATMQSAMRRGQRGGLSKFGKPDVRVSAKNGVVGRSNC
jgi:hypothetical protein